MKTSGKMAAGWLITLGFMFLTMSVSNIIGKANQPKADNPPKEGSEQVFTSPDPYDTDARDVVTGGIIFGVPTMILGGWLALDLYRQHRQEKQAIHHQKHQHLQSQFYQMLQQNQGQITVLGFAIQSQLPASEARLYLDQKAKEFHANFQVNDEGAVSYHFDV
jgi:hypothetical protein